MHKLKLVSGQTHQVVRISAIETNWLDRISNQVKKPKTIIHYKLSNLELDLYFNNKKNGKKPSCLLRNSVTHKAVNRKLQGLRNISYSHVQRSLEVTYCNRQKQHY